jgi:[ribosomal protein S5]-alanine N-acetyltransferase
VGARARKVVVEKPSLDREREFLDAVGRSRGLLRRWASPPRTPKEYRAFLSRVRGPRHYGHFICTEAGELAGVININEIVRGRSQSGSLGYYAFVPHEGQGYMRAGLQRIIRMAFRTYRLRRVDANIQPSNARSIALVESLGFTCEGCSSRHIKIGGRWRDHDRWALYAR